MFDSVLQGIELNKHFVSLVHASPDFSLVTEPSFALSVIRLTPPSIVSTESDKDKLEATLNDLNKDYYSRLSLRRRESSQVARVLRESFTLGRMREWDVIIYEVEQMVISQSIYDAASV